MTITAASRGHHSKGRHRHSLAAGQSLHSYSDNGELLGIILDGRHAPGFPLRDVAVQHNSVPSLLHHRHGAYHHPIHRALHHHPPAHHITPPTTPMPITSATPAPSPLPIHFINFPHSTLPTAHNVGAAWGPISALHSPSAATWASMPAGWACRV